MYTNRKSLLNTKILTEIKDTFIVSESTTSQNKASSDTQSPAPDPYHDPESIPTPDLYLILEIIQYLAPAPDPGGVGSGVVAGSPFD